MIKNPAPALLTCIFLLSACNSSRQGVIEGIEILPNPVSVEESSGSFKISASTTIQVQAGLQSTAALFADQIEGMISIRPEIAPEESGGIILKLDDSLEGEEEYTISVSEDAVKIAGKTEKGIFYGTQTFLQLLPPDGKTYKTIELPCVKIRDYPRFSWRGIHLDESRHFLGADFVKGLLDQMARLKFNVFHWHLIDDQGFRIEIKQYPMLTEIGAWRLDNENGVWNYSVVQPGEGDPKYGGFYTQEEIREIVSYAAERQITIVPEVEMPGHATSMIWAYPELSCKDDLWSIKEGGGFEFSDPLCAGNERTFEVLEGILSEVIDLFPSHYIHIGGDECKKDPWQSCKKCQQRMKNEKLENVYELQSYFIKRIEKFVRSKGRAIIGWDEILEGGLAPEAAVMSWRGFGGGIAAAEMGHKVVMSPTSFCYFDYYQGNPLYEPKAIGGNLPLSKVYQFDPLPWELSQDKHHLILGGQANVWTEHIFTPDQAEYMIFPRAFAMAEVLWTQKDKLDYEDFLDRILPRYKALASMGVNFRMPMGEGLEEQVLFKEEILVELFNPFSDGEAVIHYTLDGSTPDVRSPVYTEALLITETACLKAMLHFNDYSSNVAVSWFFKVDHEVNGLHCEYYEGAWEKLPDFDQLTPLDSYIVSDIGANAKSGTTDNYGMRFTGFLEIHQSGELKFYTASDDGSRLIINGEVVIDHDGLHGPDLKSNTVKLDKGKHSLEILFFEGSGGEYLEVGILDKDGVRQKLFPSSLFLESR